MTSWRGLEGSPNERELRGHDRPASLGAIAISIILFTVGSKFGLSRVEPWSFANRAPETFAIGAAIWLIVMRYRPNWISCR